MKRVEIARQKWKANHKRLSLEHLPRFFATSELSLRDIVFIVFQSFDFLPLLQQSCFTLREWGEAARIGTAHREEGRKVVLVIKPSAGDGDGDGDGGGGGFLCRFSISSTVCFVCFFVFAFLGWFHRLFWFIIFRMGAVQIWTRARKIEHSMIYVLILWLFQPSR